MEERLNSARPSGTESPAGGHGGFLRPFLALSTLGILGVAGSVPLVAGMLRGLPDPPGMPFGVLVALSLLQPALLVLAGVAVGLFLAPRLGLRSHVAAAAGRGNHDGRRLAAEIPIALLVGIGVGAVTLALELAFRPVMGAEAATDLAGTRTLLYTLSGVLYGGIAEELMIRWGLMSLLAFAVVRILPSGGSAPALPSAMWIAIVASALLFGALHLPALALSTELTFPVVLRTLLLNGLAAVAFGWLFWRRSLEAAMVAHGMTHVTLTLLAAAGLA